MFIKFLKNNWWFQGIGNSFYTFVNLQFIFGIALDMFVNL